MSANTDPREIVMRFATGYWATQMVHAAAELDLATVIGDGSASAHELSDKIGAHERSLARLMRGLVALGILRRADGDRYALTDAGQLLRRDRAGSLYGFLRMAGGAEHYRAWGGLLDGVRTGRMPFEVTFGKPVFEHFAEHPEVAAIFDGAMASVTANTAIAVAEAYDWGRFESICDLGGGVGTLLAAILGKHARPRGVVADQPSVIERARPWLAERGLASRVSLAPCDFFAAVPSGSEAYVMKSILHDWDDDKSLAILRHLRRAIRTDGTLLLVELVMPDAVEPGMAAPLNDLNMLVMTGGCERTEGEWRKLLGDGGFRLERVIATRVPASILEARPV